MGGLHIEIEFEYNIRVNIFRLLLVLYSNAISTLTFAENIHMLRLSPEITFVELLGL